MSDLPIFEEIKDVQVYVQEASKQFNINPLCSVLKIYGSKKFPLYHIVEVSKILEIKNIDNVVKHFTQKELVTAIIKDDNGNKKVSKLFTEHGMYRIMMINSSPIGEIFREFIYLVLDKLKDDGIVHLEKIQNDLQNNFQEELKNATNYLQLKIQNLELEIASSSKIIRRNTELMHKKIMESSNLSQEQHQLKAKISVLEERLLKVELDIQTDAESDEALLDYLKAKYMKKYLIYLLPDKRGEDDSYDYKNYDLSNPPDENDVMCYRITPRECKTGRLVKEIYFEYESHFIDLKNRLNNINNKQADTFIGELEIIIELSNEIRSGPILDIKKTKRTLIENSLAEMRKLYNIDY